MQGFPEKYHILPTAEQFINRVKGFARFLTHQETELCLSEHIREHEYQPPQLPFDQPHAVSEGWLAFDDMGNYHTEDL